MTTRSLMACAMAMIACLTPGVATATATPAAQGMRAACTDTGPSTARCLTSYRSAGAIRAATPDGLGATDLAAAYRLPTGRATSTVVGISIAYDAPNLEQDLNIYRQQYGLPPCTT